ncbi:DUF2314 domain-containing protein [Actinacidiphila sp. ITFR-21]|uniref:DUF2314 domain-containing protein n=1 Tax=Actinacidiphila sp. ITFR-21 TaxID=3075199 RepID=UPI0028896517|nr:DUF2314 domain-containing protein [Streptomyces sp. ITFR-21]WNI18273.1 DUF2314 domain-containing protein [Streptomyces sp. ITFR-21]
MIAELVGAVASWPLLVAALVVFGFAPGALLRLVVLAFERDDPRRAELRAELTAVPRVERPFWVIEQLEVALFDGLWPRLLWAATGRVIDRWHLTSGVKSNRRHPQSFWIPSAEEKRALRPGIAVKLMFNMRDGWGERMWVEIVAIKKRKIVGVLHNQPIGIPRLYHGDKVRFKYDHIIDIDWDDDSTQLCQGPSAPNLLEET